jgi:hypothetical protein
MLEGMAPVKPRLAVPRPPRARRRVELAPEELRRCVDSASLGFSTTAEVEPLSGTIGQPRSLEAIEYGLEVETAGFNLTRPCATTRASTGSSRTTPRR